VIEVSKKNIIFEQEVDHVVFVYKGLISFFKLIILFNT
jgi:hypothetical protein